jgi:glycosyltransferase involved in cell wall biosynthesis
LINFLSHWALPAPSFFPAILRENIHISVVIPTYNRAVLLRRAVESVLRQTRKPDEVVVVDDGSTDDTASVASLFGHSIRYLRQQNAGSSAARNRGVEEARCEWIAFLDSDDVWTEAHLDRIADAIHATDGEALIYFSDMDQTTNEGGGRLWDFCGFRISGEHELRQDASEWVMMERQPMMLQTSVVRKSAYLEQEGLWPILRTRHDTHFFLKIGIGKPACAVSGIGAIQTSDDNPGNRLMSASGPETRGYWLETIPMYMDILSRAPHLTTRHRRTLRSRLAMAHWRVARLDWTQRNIGESIQQGARSMIVAPMTMLGVFAQALRRGAGINPR